jgi:hypothetical protein
MEFMSLTLPARDAGGVMPSVSLGRYWRYVGLAYTILRRYREALAAFDHLTIHPYRVSAYMAGLPD